MGIHLRRCVKSFSVGGLTLCLLGWGSEQGPTSALGQISGSSHNRGEGTVEAPYVIPQTEERIRIDGVLDDAPWQRARVLELNYEQEPGENIAPPVETEVLLICDRQHLFAAFRCYDPDPSAIRAYLLDRDHLGGQDDWVEIVLDTFNDERRSFNLSVNPLGVQDDYVDTAGGGGSWDGIWDSAGRVTDWGYAVEIAVPFNQIRFQRTSEEQVWGFDAVRHYPRSQEHRIGLFPRDRSNNCYLCQAVKIRGFVGVSPGKNVEVNPSVTTVRTDARDALPDGPFRTGDQDTDVGLTARWGWTPNLTLTSTLNPDFSQVEADAMQLDINEPFALYYSERRPFFTEGSDFFGTLKTAIHTRTVREPLWGMKLSGKEGSHTIGAYVVEDDRTNLIFPGSESSETASLDIESTASVFRYKRDIGSRYTLGALATNREAGDYANHLAGVDGNFLLTNTDQIQIQILGSRTQYPGDVAMAHGQRTGRFDGGFVALEYDHESRGTGWWLDYDQVDTGFRADLGFIPMVDFRNVEGGIHHKWYGPEGAWWYRCWLGSEAHYYEDRRGRVLARDGSLWFCYSGARQSWLSLEGGRSREAYGDLDFNLTSYRADGGFSPTRRLQVKLYTRFGNRIDYANGRVGRRVYVEPWIRYHFGRHLSVVMDLTYERLNVDGGRLYTANVGEIRAVYHINVRTFFRAILQYRDYQYNPGLYTFAVDPEDRRFFTELLFSYKINPRTVLFLGYTDNHYGTQDYGLTQNDRTFFAKLGYAWVL